MEAGLLETVEGRLDSMRERLWGLGGGLDIRLTKGGPTVLTVLCDREALLSHFRDRLNKVTSDVIPAQLLLESLSHFAALNFMANLGLTCGEFMEDLVMTAVLAAHPQGMRGKNLDTEKNRIKKLIKERSKVRAKHLAGTAKSGPRRGATWQQKNTKRISGLRLRIDDEIRAIAAEGEYPSRELVAARLGLPNPKSLDRQRGGDDQRSWRQVVREALT